MVGGKAEERNDAVRFSVRRRSERLQSEPETDELMLETTGGTCFRASNDLASATARRWVLMLMMVVVAKVTAAYPGATCVRASSPTRRNAPRSKFHPVLFLPRIRSRSGVFPEKRKIASAIDLRRTCDELLTFRRVPASLPGSDDNRVRRSRLLRRP